MTSLKRPGLRRVSVYAVVFLHTSTILPLFTERAEADDKVDFDREIRPLLSEHCFPCHGPDEEKRKGDLRLDTAEGLFAPLEDEDGFAVVSGAPDESAVYARLVTDKKRKLMPPPKFNKPLSAENIQRVRRWIQEGAQWKKHWAFVKPRQTTVPQLSDTRWPRNQIDSFILARLEEEGLTPSPEADKATAIRRVSFDLTGLPPTSAEVDAFLLDNASGAYERVVDRLLDSPHYGEHMARYWLDAARYGDTHGLHLDNLRKIWPYRDWVIAAFNRNMPFDQFTIEQLAGDLLPEATDEQRIATGFSRCNVTTSEGGVIPEEYQVHYTVDRVATMSTVWMGVSMGCVRCHEHKFDPFAMKDFYQLYAFFNSLDGPVMDGNKPLPLPILRTLPSSSRESLAELEPRLVAAKEKVAARHLAVAGELLAWEESQRSRGEETSFLPSAGLVGHWPFEERVGDTVLCAVGGVPPARLCGAGLSDGKLGKACKVGESGYVDLGDTADFDVDAAFSFGAWVRFDPGDAGGTVISRRGDDDAQRGYELVVTSDRILLRFVHRWPRNALEAEFKKELAPQSWHYLLVTYDGSGRAAGVQLYLNGESNPLKVRKDTLNDTIHTNASLRVGFGGSDGNSDGSSDGSSDGGFEGLVDEVRIYDRVLSRDEARDLVCDDAIRTVLATVGDDRKPEQQERLRSYYLTNFDRSYRELNVTLESLERQRRRIEIEGAIETLTWKDSPEPKPAYVLLRGEYDKPGERVYRDTPAAFPPLPRKPEGEMPTRLDLARWLVSPEHPLTSRVTVNRFWQQYFGTGIVKTSEDFGSQGEQPSHPELLDWLAVEFQSRGWNVKQLQKLIVMSATYRQSSRWTNALGARDPENRLLARGPRFRLDAEAIRDNALAVSGLLIREMGGPSVRPYQPPGIWEAVGYTDSNTANYVRDSGDALYRRSLYTFWKRTAPPPSMVAFDAPSRENCSVRRSRTNTPMAALTLMNDEQFVEASRVLAARVLSDGGDTDELRGTYAFRLVTARRPDRDELETLLYVYRNNLSRFEVNTEAAEALIHVGESAPSATSDASRLAAWTIVGSLLFNLDETITKG